jgi:hypothetical protein
MSIGGVLLLVTCGAAVLSVWTHFRYPKLQPASMKRNVLHVVAAILALNLVTMTSQSFGEQPSFVSQMTLLYGLLLPSLFYAFLTAVWLLSLLKAQLPTR